jgi:large subunit ribosomal protein L6
MSRVGKVPIPIPSGVTVDTDGTSVRVKGPKGELGIVCPAGVKVSRAEAELRVERTEETAVSRANHGLARKLVANMVHGVSVGFTRVLEINGVGYRAEVKDGGINFTLGYSHPIAFPLPPGITARVERQTIITLSGADRQLLGQIAAAIRELRRVEPYKAKGIKYSDEIVRRKAGKAAAGAGAR